MNEIVPDIFTWAWFSEPHGYNFNGYLVRHTEGNLCVDPVLPGDESLAEIAHMGVASILLTNRNHSRAANRTTPPMPEARAPQLMANCALARRSAR
jgi:hypothetical protein